MALSTQDRGAQPPDLWDPVVRISHWGIALVVLANAMLTKGGGTLHVWIGWIGMALLILRLIWGLVGTTEARFSAFPPSPRAALAHVADLLAGKPQSYGSHNPAGALMVYALWGCLAVVIATGLVMTGGATPMQVAAENAAVAKGDWSVLVKDGEDGEPGESDEAGESGEGLEDVHELAANLILGLAFLHVAGVVIESRAMRRNLVASMVLGQSKQDRA